jgi:hypothetical protein
MAVVRYDSSGSGGALVPAPLYTLSENIRRTGDGTPISVEYNITLSGTTVACKGSPTGAASFGVSLADETCADSDAKFQSIVRKQNVIRSMFNEDGKLFEITDDSGGVRISCYPKVASVTFSEDINVEKSDYTIVLVAHQLVGTGGDDYPESIVAALRYNLENLSESFDISRSNDYDENGAELPIFNISHSVTAKSHKYYNSSGDIPGPPGEGLDNQGYRNARTVVHSLMELTGISDGGHLHSVITSSEYFDGGGETFGDYDVSDSSVSESGDYYDGSYGATRSITLVKTTGTSSVPARHEYTVEESRNRPLNDRQHGYENTFSINGTIQGFSTATATSPTPETAYANAKTMYDEKIKQEGDGHKKVLDLIKSVIDVDPNITDTWATPISKTVSHNKRNGLISYSCNFKENPAANNPNADKYFADFSLKVTDRHDNNKIAVIPILGRVGGPIIQDLSTTDVLRRTISGSFLLKNTGDTLEGGHPWGTDKLNVIREEAINVIEAAPVKLLGGSDTYYVEDWSDGLDVFSGTYDITLTLIYARSETEPVTPPTGAGWWLPGLG